MKIILYPGKFKPFCDANYVVVKDILRDQTVDTVAIIISPSLKERIDPETIADFARYIFRNESRVEVRVDFASNSPIKTCYDYVANNPGDEFGLVATTYDDTDTRGDQFVNYFKDREDVKVFKYNYGYDSMIKYLDGEKYESEVSEHSVYKDLLEDNFEEFTYGFVRMYVDGKFEMNDLRQYYATLRKNLDKYPIPEKKSRKKKKQ